MDLRKNAVERVAAKATKIQDTLEREYTLAVRDLRTAITDALLTEDDPDKRAIALLVCETLSFWATGDLFALYLPEDTLNVIKAAKAIGIDSVIGGIDVSTWNTDAQFVNCSEIMRLSEKACAAWKKLRKFKADVGKILEKK